MAEKAGDAALAANPHWLIFVEGIDHYQGQYYWWAATWRPPSATR
jgi:endoglucanase